MTPSATNHLCYLNTIHKQLENKAAEAEVHHPHNVDEALMLNTTWHTIMALAC